MGSRINHGSRVVVVAVLCYIHLPQHLVSLLTYSTISAYTISRISIYLIHYILLCIFTTTISCTFLSFSSYILYLSPRFAAVSTTISCVHFSSALQYLVCLLYLVVIIRSATISCILHLVVSVLPHHNILHPISCT